MYKYSTFFVRRIRLFYYINHVSSGIFEKQKIHAAKAADKSQYANNQYVLLPTPSTEVHMTFSYLCQRFCVCISVLKIAFTLNRYSQQIWRPIYENPYLSSAKKPDAANAFRKWDMNNIGEWRWGLMSTSWGCVFC